MSIDAELARKLRRASAQQRRWLAARDDLIQQARASGASYREIAALAGMTHVGVMRIVSKLDLEVHHIPPDSPYSVDGDNMETVTPNEHARRHRGR